MTNPLAGSTNYIANSLHLPADAQIAYLVGLRGAVGGLMLAFGLLTRVIVPMVPIQMAVICFLLGRTLGWIDRGMEHALLMAFLVFYISSNGPGPYSLDWKIGREI